MCITGENMLQTSNSLLSPTKSMVARGNQCLPRTNNDANPPHTSMHESHWLSVPTTANEIIGNDEPN